MERDKGCSGCQILLYPPRQPGQGFDFSAGSSCVKAADCAHVLPTVLKLSNRALCTEIMSKTHPLPWVRVCTAGLIRSQLGEEKGMPPELPVPREGKR